MKFYSIRLQTIKNLGVFYCLCFAINTSVANKFDSRAHLDIVISCPFNHKGYKIIDLETKKIYVSLDVAFQEIIFPFKDTLSLEKNLLLSTEPIEYYDYNISYDTLHHQPYHPF